MLPDSDRKNSVVGLNCFLTDIVSEPISQLLGNENDLSLTAAFRGGDCDLPLIGIFRSQRENFSYPHRTPTHEFQDQPVPQIASSKDDFIYPLLLYDFSLNKSWTFKSLSENF